MKPRIVREIIACLPKGKTPFRYFKDRYAFYLLACAAGSGCSIVELRRSPVGRLLDKPIVKQFIASRGGKRVSRSDFLQYWTEPSEPFVLGIAAWGDSSRYWRSAQLSRRGVNLVLQLNFTNRHQSEYYRLIKPQVASYLNGSEHPVMRVKPGKFHRDTLSWARIDLDFDTNEALIEEIQSDWVRYADWRLRPVVNCQCRTRRCGYCKYVQGRKSDIAHYLEQTLEHYREIWMDAMLTATIEFIVGELGITAIYYHSHASGVAHKNIGTTWRQPPRSLYSKLPRKFCFQSTDCPPSFLGAGRHGAGKANQFPWYKLQVSESTISH